jgi:hypothetical protein
VLAVAAIGCGAFNRAAEPKKLPLTSVFANFEQEGLKRATLDEKQPFQHHLEFFLKLKPVASNVFLATAEDLNEAIGAGLRFNGRPELAIPSPDDKAQLWLIVYFGSSSSSPPQWSIVSIEQSDNKITVEYERPANNVQRTADLNPYFAFAPMPKLEAGLYDLELKDRSANLVTIARKVRLRNAM